MSEELAEIKKIAGERLDSLSKIIQNRTLGRQKGVDKTQDIEIKPVNKLSAEELTILYENSDLCARVIDVPADLMTAQWTTVEVAEAEDSSILDGVRDYEDELESISMFNEVLKWAFLYGKAYIVIGAEDGQTLDQELDLTKLETVKYLIPLTRHQVFPAPGQLNIRYPDFYQVHFYPQSADEDIRAEPITSFTSTTIHKSRILPFDGVPTPPTQRDHVDGGGDSKLQRFFWPYISYHLAYEAVADMLVEYDIYVHSYEGLADIIMAGKEGELRRHMEDINELKSTLRSILIDGKFESGHFLNRNLGSIDKVLEKLEHRVTTAADMPYMFLWNQVGRAGMGDSGEAERLMAALRTTQLQNKMLRKNLKYYYKLLFCAKDGPTKGKPPKNWSFAFNPIVILNPTQESEVRHKDSMTIKALIESKVITPGEGRSLHSGNHYRSNITLDPKVKPIYEYSEKPQPGQLGQEPNANRKPDEEYKRKKKLKEIGSKENTDNYNRSVEVGGYSIPVVYEPGSWVDNIQLLYARGAVGDTDVVIGGSSLELPYCFETAIRDKRVISIGFMTAEGVRLALNGEYEDEIYSIAKRPLEGIFNV